jgi:hypothetical protein
MVEGLFTILFSHFLPMSLISPNLSPWLVTEWVRKEEDYLQALQTRLSRRVKEGV